MKLARAYIALAALACLATAFSGCAKWHDGPMDTPMALAPSGADSAVRGKGSSGGGDAGMARAADEIAAMRLYFAFNRWELKPESRQTLARAASLLRQYPGLGLRIDGHCDQIGPDEYNFALGERRARTAYAALVRSGVNPAQLAMATFGKRHPASPGTDPQSRALNRRDEFILFVPCEVVSRNR